MKNDAGTLAGSWGQERPYPWKLSTAKVTRGLLATSKAQVLPSLVLVTSLPQRPPPQPRQVHVLVPLMYQTPDYIEYPTAPGLPSVQNCSKHNRGRLEPHKRDMGWPAPHFSQVYKSLWYYSHPRLPESVLLQTHRLDFNSCSLSFLLFCQLPL